MEWGTAHQPLSVSEKQMIELSCYIKISTVNHLVLSQSTRVADGQTDRRTDTQTDSQDGVSIKLLAR